MKFLITLFVLLATFSTASADNYNGVETHFGTASSKTLNTPTRIGNNIWQMQFLLGNGFNFNKEEIQDHRIYDQFESTYFSTKTSTQQATGKFAFTQAEYADQLDIGGEMSVTYGTISGSGSLSYSEETSSQVQNVFYWQDYVQQCGCISIDNKVMSEQLAKDIQDSNMDLDAMRKKYGDFWISNVCYGSTFKLEFTFSLQSSAKASELAGSLKGQIGIGALTIAAEVNGSGSESNSESSTSSEMHAEINGFDVPCALVNPKTAEEVEQLQNCVEQIVAELNTSCKQWEGGANLSLDDIFEYKKGLFPISVRVEPIQHIDPFDFPAAKYEKMMEHIQDAWESVRYLNDYVYTIENMYKYFTDGVIREVSDVDSNIGGWQIFVHYNRQYVEIHDLASKYLADLIDYVGGETVDFDYFYQHSSKEIFDAADKQTLEVKGKMIDGVHEQEYKNSIFRGIFVTEDGGSAEPFYGSLSYNAGAEVVRKVMLNDDGVIKYASLCADGVNCFLVKKDNPLDQFDLDVLREGDICIQEDGSQNTVLKIKPWTIEILLDNNQQYEGVKCKKGSSEVAIGEIESSDEIAVGNSIKILRTPTKIQDNIWQMTFLLGSGFSFNNEEIQDHRVYDHRESTYVIEAHKSHAASGKFASSVAEYSSQLDLGGKLSVTYGPISGSGSMSYNSKTSSQQQHVFYTQEYTQMCGCVSFQNKVMNQQLVDDIADGMNVDKLRSKYGDYYINNVCYGSNFKLEFTFTSSSSSDSTELKGELEGKIGIAGLTVTASVNAAYSESNSESSTSSEIQHEANGFKVPCAIKNPIEGSEYDADALQACVAQIVDKLADSCADFESHSGQDIDDVLTKKGGLFPINVQIVPISDVPPFNFPVEKYQVMKKHLDAAWDAVRFLNDFIGTIEDMMNTFSKKVIHEVMDVSTSIVDWPIYQKYHEQYTTLHDKATKYLNDMLAFVGDDAVTFDDIYYTNPDSIFSAHQRMELMYQGRMIDGFHEKAYGTALFRGIFVMVDHEPQPFFGSLFYADDVVSKVMINDDGIIAYASLCGTGVNDQSLHNCFLVPKTSTAIDRFDLDILVEEDICVQPSNNNRKNKIAKIDNWAQNVLLDNRLRYPGNQCQKFETESSVGDSLAEVAVGNSMQIIRTQTDDKDGPYQNMVPLGYGFNFGNQERMELRIFGRNSTFLIEEHTSQTGFGKFASSTSEYSSQLEVGGKLSVSFGPISGEGSLTYNEQTSTQQQNVFYWQEYTQTCGCVSYDKQWVDQELYDDIVINQKPLNELRAQYGDYYVSNVCYGSTFKVEFTFTSQSQEDITDLEGKLKGQLGIGPLTISAEVNFEEHTSNSYSSTSSTMHSESNGFDMPSCKLDNPQSVEDATKLDNCILQTVENLSNSCEGFISGRGYTLNDVLKQKGSLFATAVTVMPISDIAPFNFPTEKYSVMKRHIDMAWDGIRFLDDFTTNLEKMMDKFTTKVIHEINDIDFNVVEWQIYKKYNENYHRLKENAEKFLADLQAYLAQDDLETFYTSSPDEYFSMQDKITLESEGKLIDGIHEKAYGTAVFRGIFVEMDNAVQPFYGTLTFAFDVVSKVMLNDGGVIAYASLCGCGANDMDLHNCFLVGKGKDQTMLDDFDLDILKKGDICLKEDGTMSKIIAIDDWSQYVHLEDGTLYEGTKCTHDGCPTLFQQKGKVNHNNQINSEHQIGSVYTVEQVPELVMIEGCADLCQNESHCYAFTYNSWEQLCTLGTSHDPDGSFGDNNRFCTLTGMKCRDHTCPAGYRPKHHSEDTLCLQETCTDEECCQVINTCASMECPPHWQRKSTPAHEIICSDNGLTCTKHECCDSCQDVDPDCQLMYHSYMIFCTGFQDPQPDQDFHRKINNDCQHCRRWDEFEEEVRSGWDSENIDDFLGQCGASCSTCVPEEHKCYDSDTIKLDGTSGTTDWFTCSDYYDYGNRCPDSLTDSTPEVDPDRDCCACGGGRIGPKCPKEYPYWGYDLTKYWKTYVCWAHEDASYHSQDCSNFCIRQKNVNLDKLEDDHLNGCGASSICPDDSNVDNIDCSLMTATLHNIKTGNVFAKNIQAYEDSSGRKCIFEHYKDNNNLVLAAVYKESCQVATVGNLDLTQSKSKTCHDSKRTGCWEDTWTKSEIINGLSDLRGCKDAVIYCPIGENGKCGPYDGFCAESLYCNEYTGECGDTAEHKAGSTGEYDRFAYSKCLADEGYCEPYSIEACEAAASRLGLETGGGNYPFVDPNRQIKGCYAYPETDGSLPNMVYYGSGGTMAQMQAATPDYAYRPEGYDCKPKCVPYSEDACRAAALKSGLSLGGGSYPFVGENPTVKGCYAYRPGVGLAWMAYYSPGGTDEEMAAAPDVSMFRPHGYDCNNVCPDKCYTCKAQDGQLKLCTQWCSQYGYCGSEPEFYKGGVDCTQCFPEITSDYQIPYMVASTQDTTTSEIPYGKFIIFGVFAFGLGYGYSRYAAAKTSKYAPLVADNI